MITAAWRGKEEAKVKYTKKNIVNDVMIAVEWLQENNVPFWQILRKYGILHYLSQSKLNHMKKEQLTLLSSDLVRVMYNPT